MSIHNDPRQHSENPEDREDFERDLRYEYRREEYENRHPYEHEDSHCGYQGEDGSCNYDGHCVHQMGKWRDSCGVWKEREDEDEEV